jgi:hypothetical protein
LLFLAFVHLPSLRPIAKYVVGNPVLVACAYGLTVLLAFTAMLALGKRVRWRDLLLSARGICGLLLLVLLVSLVVYPIADGLKAVGRGSTQDDAVIDAARNLWFHGDPYVTETYNGPISPGPGWVILVAPFSLTGLYVLFLPFSASVLAWSCSRLTRDTQSIARFLFAAFSSVGVWEYFAIGGDLFSLGVTILLLLLALDSGMQTRPRFVAYCAFFSLVMTARVVIPILIPVFSLLVGRRHGLRRGVVFVVSTSLATALIHIFFYARSEVYQPFHILPAAVSALGSIRWPLGLLFLLAVAGIAAGLARAIRDDTLEMRLWVTAIVVTGLVSAMAVLDLKIRGFNPAVWEGQHYLMMAIPIWVAYCARRYASGGVVEAGGLVGSGELSDRLLRKEGEP